ncbi:hypothetical protein ACFX13_010204 [Malus domestica]
MMAALMAPWGLLPRPIRILSVSRLLVMVAYVVIGDRELKTPAEAETVYAMDKMKDFLADTMDYTMSKI